MYNVCQPSINSINKYTIQLLYDGKHLSQYNITKTEI